MGNTGESSAAYMENRKERPIDASEGSKGTDCKWYISKDGDDGDACKYVFGPLVK